MSYSDINGKFSGQGLTVKEIAAKIRSHLKKAYPLCKWSVTKDGSSIDIALMEAPFSPWCDLDDERVQRRIADAMENNPLCSHPSHYIEQGYKEYCNGGALDKELCLSKEAQKVFQEVYDYAQDYNYNHSDVYADYFDVGFYLDLSIGKWNKPFLQISA